MIWRIIKTLFFLMVLGAIALVIFAYLGPIMMPDAFDPPRQEIRLPLQLDLGQ